MLNTSKCSYFECAGTNDKVDSIPSMENSCVNTNTSVLPPMVNPLLGDQNTPKYAIMEIVGSSPLAEHPGYL